MCCAKPEATRRKPPACCTSITKPFISKIKEYGILQLETGTEVLHSGKRKRQNLHRRSWRRSGRNPEGLGRLGGKTRRTGRIAVRAFPGRENIRGSGEELRGIYGFTVKVGLGEEGPRSSPSGTFAATPTPGETEVQEVREPMVDVFEEDGPPSGSGGIARHRRRGRAASR